MHYISACVYFGILKKLIHEKEEDKNKKNCIYN